MALPEWLDQTPNVNYELEKKLLLQVLSWAKRLGWVARSTDGMDFSSSHRADLVLSKNDQSLRIEVKSKGRATRGEVRIQAIPTFKDADYLWKPKKKKWEISIGGVAMAQYDDEKSFKWLVERLFAR